MNASDPNATAAELRHQFDTQLANTCYAERHLTECISHWRSLVPKGPLEKALEELLEVSQLRAARVSAIFELLGEKVRSEHCRCITEITQEADTSTGRPISAERERALIRAALNAENYIADTYSVLALWADRLHLEQIVEYLKKNLHHGHAADAALGLLAAA